MRPYRLQAMRENNLKTVRESLLLSKTELARKAGVSPLTIDRIEKGHTCRVDTMRKILHALGLKVSDRGRVFGSQAAKERDKELQEKPSMGEERDAKNRADSMEKAKPDGI